MTDDIYFSHIAEQFGLIMTILATKRVPFFKTFYIIEYIFKSHLSKYEYFYC